MTIRDLSTFLGIPRKRVYEILRRGAETGLQSFRVGRGWRVDLDQLRLWMTEQIDDEDS
jgi:excisionase family DNA binding protein